MRGARAFTLLELLLTLILMAILSAIAIPAFNQFLQRGHAAALRMQLMRAMHFARTQAVVRHERIMLCPSANQVTCGGAWQQGFIIQTTGDAAKILHVFHFAMNNGVLHSRFFPRGRVALTFFASGWPDIQNGTFWFCANRAVNPQWALVINRTGRIREVLPGRYGEIVDDVGAQLIC